MDNFGVGISYGNRRINIPFYSNFLIALISTCGTIISILVGFQISKLFPIHMSNIFGALLLSGVGIWVFTQKVAVKSTYQSDKAELKIKKSIFFKILDHPFLKHEDFLGEINLKEGFFLGLALTFNNLANGFGAGILHLNIILIIILTFIFSIITIWLGINLGFLLGIHWFGKYANKISGLFLIALAIYEYLALKP